MESYSVEWLSEDGDLYAYVGIYLYDVLKSTKGTTSSMY